MSESTRRVDLRLTIPASAPWREVATELAEKFAEYAGAAASEVAGVSRRIAGAMPRDDRRLQIELLLSAEDGRISVTVTSSSD